MGVLRGITQKYIVDIDELRRDLAYMVSEEYGKNYDPYNIDYLKLGVEEHKYRQKYGLRDGKIFQFLYGGDSGKLSYSVAGALLRLITRTEKENPLTVKRFMEKKYSLSNGKDVYAVLVECYYNKKPLRWF